MPKVLFQLYIDVKQFEFVKEESQKTGKSRAQIVREIIEKERKEKANETR